MQQVMSVDEYSCLMNCHVCGATYNTPIDGLGKIQPKCPECNNNEEYKEEFVDEQDVGNDVKDSTE